MFLKATLVISALLMPASVDKHVTSRNGDAAETGLSYTQKVTKLTEVTQAAKQCITRKAFSDARFLLAIDKLEVTESVMHAFLSCADSLRTMIDSYDKLLGPGKGELFMMGPFMTGIEQDFTTMLKRLTGPR